MPWLGIIADPMGLCCPGGTVGMPPPPPCGGIGCLIEAGVGLPKRYLLWDLILTSDIWPYIWPPMPGTGGPPGPPGGPETGPLPGPGPMGILTLGIRWAGPLTGEEAEVGTIVLLLEAEGAEVIGGVALVLAGGVAEVGALLLEILLGLPPPPLDLGKGVVGNDTPMLGGGPGGPGGPPLCGPGGGPWGPPV